MTEVGDRPVIAVSWRPGDRPVDRLTGAVVERELRRRLPDASIVRWEPGIDRVDGVVGEASADAVARLPLDARGRLPVGPVAALADGLDRHVLRRRGALLRAVGWYPAEPAPAVVVDVTSGTELALRHGEVLVELSGGTIEAVAPGSSAHRLPDVALPVDLAAAVAQATRVVTDHESAAAAADAFGVEIEWCGVGVPVVDRHEIIRVLDEFAAAVHVNALRRRPLDVLGAELRRDAASDRRRRQADQALRRRYRAARDELADRIVAHEQDRARLADRERRSSR